MAKIALIFAATFYILIHFDPKKTKFSVDFLRNFKHFGLKWALTSGFISKQTPLK